MKDVLVVLGLMVCFVAAYYFLKTLIIGWDPKADRGWFWTVISAIFVLASAPVFLLVWLYMQKGHEMGRQETLNETRSQYFGNLKEINDCHKQIEQLKQQVSIEYRKGFNDGFQSGKSNATMKHHDVD